MFIQRPRGLNTNEVVREQEKKPCEPGRERGKDGEEEKTLFVAGKRGEAISAVMRRRRRCVGAEAGGGAKIILRHFFPPLGFLRPTKGHPPKKKQLLCTRVCLLDRLPSN